MKILVACFKFPEHDTNSGDQRLVWIIRALKEHGDQLVILARDANHPRYRADLEALGVECICDSEIHLRDSSSRLRDYLIERSFDAALFSSFGIYNTYAWILRAYLPHCHLALDTVDLNYLRLERESVFYPHLTEEANMVKREEMKAIKDADSVWVISNVEKTILSSHFSSADKPIHVVPSTHKITDSTPAYEDRKGILFVGSYTHRPNVDAINYFMRDIYPRLQDNLIDVPLTIAGSNPPSSFDQYRSETVTVTGYVEDHRVLLLSHRIGIAPLRFGAGLKGKVLDYLACGLPCVTTDIGAEGMEVTTGHQLLIANNAAEFADNLQSLYRDPRLWQALAISGKQFVKDRYSYSNVSDLVKQARESMKIAPTQKFAFSLLTIEHFSASPNKVFSLTKSAFAALKRGGIDELSDRIKVWSRKPPS